jgi:hypothetical protein
MNVALALAALLAVVAVAFVARPFVREPEPVSDRLDELSEPERRRLELVEERDRALEALKELEFDHRTGKVSDDDYRELVGPLRRRAAETLRALEPRAEAGERIREARFAVQETMMVTPNEPYPPPGEATPPQPAIVPEPYPPPDEGTPPTPALVPEPGPDRPSSPEPAE